MQLIRDGTYFLVEVRGEIDGCGGWSRRATLSGVPLCRACGYQSMATASDDRGGAAVPLLRMGKAL